MKSDIQHVYYKWKLVTFGSMCAQLAATVVAHLFNLTLLFNVQPVSHTDPHRKT